MPWRLTRNGEFLKYGLPPHEILTWTTKAEAESAALYVATDYGDFGWEPIEATDAEVNRIW